MARTLDNLLAEMPSREQVESMYHWGTVETKAFEIYTDLWSATRTFAERWEYYPALIRLSPYLSDPRIEKIIRDAMRWRDFPSLYDINGTLVILVQYPLPFAEFLLEDSILPH